MEKNSFPFAVNPFDRILDCIILWAGFVPAVYVLRCAFAVNNVFLQAAIVLLAYVILVISTLLFLVLLRALLGGRVAPGQYPYESKEVARYKITLGFCTFPYRSFLGVWMGTFSFPGVYYYRLIGAQIKGPVVFGNDVKILDPLMVKIGENVILGEGSVLCGHLFYDGQMSLKPITIGNNATVGAYSFISPGVVIEDNAIVAVGAVVPMGAHIGQGQKWGGVPARRLDSN